MNFIRDTIYDLSHLDSKTLVYIAGKYYDGKLILVKMVPKDTAVPIGWKVLTATMTKANAEKRITHFKLIGLVKS